MTAEELIGKLEVIQRIKAETNTLELKSAEKGCPQLKRMSCRWWKVEKLK